jgi:hypothetical protein
MPPAHREKKYLSRIEEHFRRGFAEERKLVVVRLFAIDGAVDADVIVDIKLLE